MKNKSDLEAVGRIEEDPSYRYSSCEQWWSSGNVSSDIEWWSGKRRVM